ncbi:MAG TPA: tryptophan synthase subunit alpha [Vicinamibacterales bacterium]
MSDAHTSSVARSGAGEPGRIARAFARMRADGRTGLVTYLTAGDPSLARTRDLLFALERAGADVVELGVPFSDPLADGPVIQRASERALRGGTTLGGVLELVADVRSTLSIPIVLFTYANPVVRLGLETFADQAAAAGVDGVLLLDVPIEEADAARAVLSARGIDMIFLVSPTTTAARLARAAALGSGFLYGISRLGVTGVRDRISEEAGALASRVRQATDLPLAIGFGLSRPEHIAAVGRFADAAVVGSGLVQVIAEAGDTPSLVPRVEAYVRSLTEGAVRAGARP